VRAVSSGVVERGLAVVHLAFHKLWARGQGLPKFKGEGAYSICTSEPSGGANSDRICHFPAPVIDQVLGDSGGKRGWECSLLRMERSLAKKVKPILPSCSLWKQKSREKPVRSQFGREYR